MSLLEVMLTSKALKKVVVERSITFSIPLRYVCAEAGIDYAAFMKSYINSNRGRAKISESEFRKVLSILGIDVRYQFIINEELDMNERSKNLAEKYAKEKRNITDA